MGSQPRSMLPGLGCLAKQLESFLGLLNQEADLRMPGSFWSLPLGNPAIFWVLRQATLLDEMDDTWGGIKEIDNVLNLVFGSPMVLSAHVPPVFARS